MLRKSIFTFALVGALVALGGARASAELLLGEDFFYAEPNKPIGAIQGFQFQDYGGGAGNWSGEWAAVLDATITGPGCLDPECLGDSDLYQGAVRGGNNRVLDRTYSLPASAGNTIYFGGVIREDIVDRNSRATIYLQGATVTNFNNFVELDANSIGVGLFQGGFRAVLGDTPVDEGPDTISNDAQFHTLIGKLEINADGANERLTVWLDPTGPETGPNSTQNLGVDVISSATDLGAIDGSPFRLWTDTGLIHFDDVAVGTSWADVANLVVPRLTVEVNQKSGFARLKNTSGTTQDTLFLSVKSASSSIVRNGWEGLAAQGMSGWMENKSSNSQLVESSLTGSTLIANGANIPLGVIWNTAGTADLIPEFGTTAGLLNRAHVTLVPGQFAADFNDDGTVDAGDAGIMFGNWAGAGLADLNHDGVVDAADAGEMFAEWTGDPGTVGAGEVKAEYDPGSGNLVISSNGVINLFVQSASGKITPLNPAPPAPVGLLTNNVNRVGITNLGPINVTDFSFGSIGAGLAMSDLSLIFTVGFGDQAQTVPASADGAFRYIPEPGSLSLILLGALGCLSRRPRMDLR